MTVNRIIFILGAIASIIAIAEFFPKIMTKASALIPTEYDDAFTEAERGNGLPAGLLKRMAWTESRFDPAARSPVGALGLMQFMPTTARDMRINPMDPYQSIKGAGAYMRQLYNRFGNWEEAVAAYNWGQGNVARLGLAAAPAETRNYLTSVLG